MPTWFPTSIPILEGFTELDNLISLKGTWKWVSLFYNNTSFYTNDSIPQINNYAVLLIEIQEPDLALSALQKLAQIIKEYNSNHCLDYAQVQESLGSICLITANISQAKTHFKSLENLWGYMGRRTRIDWRKNIKQFKNCIHKLELLWQKVFFSPSTNGSYKHL